MVLRAADRRWTWMKAWGRNSRCLRTGRQCGWRIAVDCDRWLLEYSGRNASIAGRVGLAPANGRVQTTAAGHVVLKPKTPWRNGTTHVVMSLLEFMQRWTALVPWARLHLIRMVSAQLRVSKCAAPRCAIHGGRLPTPSCAHWWSAGRGGGTDAAGSVHCRARPAGHSAR